MTTEGLTANELIDKLVEALEKSKKYARASMYGHLHPQNNDWRLVVEKHCDEALALTDKWRKG